MSYVVELEEGVYLAPWSGDPGRTLVLDHAKQYKTTGAAQIALGHARRYRRFAKAEIKEPQDHE